MTEKRIGVNLTVHPNNELDAARVVERLSSMAAGFAMDGTWCELTLTPFEVIEETVEGEPNNE